jgi:hypothetical protein
MIYCTYLDGDFHTLGFKQQLYWDTDVTHGGFKNSWLRWEWEGWDRYLWLDLVGFEVVGVAVVGRFREWKSAKWGDV